MLLGASVAMSNESTVVTVLNARSVAAAPTVAADAVTVTSSRTGDRLSSKSAVTVSPAATVTVREAAARRSRSAVTRYEPAGTFVNSNLPFSVNVKAPVPRIRITAPSTSPPFSTRVTVPRTVPVSCAWTDAAAASIASVRAAPRIRRPGLPSARPMRPTHGAADTLLWWG